MVRRRIGPLLVAFSLGAAATGCGGDDTSSSPPSPDNTSAETTSAPTSADVPTTTAQPQPAPLTVDPCATLSEEQVIAFANSIGLEYQVIGPVLAQAIPLDEAFGRGTGLSPDPDLERYCSWTFLTGRDGRPSTEAPADGVEVQIIRIDQDLRNLAAQQDSEICASGFPGAVVFQGVGEYAESAVGGGVVRTPDTCTSLSYDGPIGEAFGDGPGTEIEATLAALAAAVGSG